MEYVRVSIISNNKPSSTALKNKEAVKVSGSMNTGQVYSGYDWMALRCGTLRYEGDLSGSIMSRLESDAWIRGLVE